MRHSGISPFLLQNQCGIETTNIIEEAERNPAAFSSRLGNLMFQNVGSVTVFIYQIVWNKKNKLCTITLVPAFCSFFSLCISSLTVSISFKPTCCIYCGLEGKYQVVDWIAVVRDEADKNNESDFGLQADSGISQFLELQRALLPLFFQSMKAFLYPLIVLASYYSGSYSRFAECSASSCGTEEQDSSLLLFAKLCLEWLAVLGLVTVLHRILRSLLWSSFIPMVGFDTVYNLITLPLRKSSWAFFGSLLMHAW